MNKRNSPKKELKKQLMTQNYREHVEEFTYENFLTSVTHEGLTASCNHCAFTVSVEWLISDAEQPIIANGVLATSTFAHYRMDHS